MDEQRIAAIIANEIRRHLTVNIDIDRMDFGKDITVEIKYKGEIISSDYFYVEEK